MSKKLDKADIKQPDVVTTQLKQGFEWTRTHSKAVVMAVGAFLLIGGGVSIYTTYSDMREAKIQEEFYAVEKVYLDKKLKFEEAEANEKAAAKDPKKTTEAAAAAANKATGDITKDYPESVKGFEELMAKYPNSQAAKMSALNLSEIQLKYNQTENAIATLNKIVGTLGNSDVLSALVQSQLGNTLSDNKDCKAAVTHWEKVISNSKAQFLYDEVKLRMGICFESLSEFKKAEDFYNQVSTSKPDSVLGKTAEKYKRLLKSKQSGT